MKTNSILSIQVKKLLIEIKYVFHYDSLFFMSNNVSYTLGSISKLVVLPLRYDHECVRNIIMSVGIATIVFAAWLLQLREITNITVSLTMKNVFISNVLFLSYVSQRSVNNLHYTSYSVDSLSILCWWQSLPNCELQLFSRAKYRLVIYEGQIYPLT